MRWAVATAVAAAVAVAMAGAVAGAAAGASGSVELDEYSFDKLVSKFEAALVKFDIAFPYGDKHDAYTALARDARGAPDLLVAEVGVKDYGDKDNEPLARKYGATKDDFPVVKLFLKGKPEPITFKADEGFTTDALRRFVRDKSGIYLSLPGCVEELDKLALEFTKATKERREQLLNKAEAAQKDLAEKDVASGKMYKLIMQRVLEKGDGFIDSEVMRIKKLSAGKVSDEKKKELNTRLNILHTFQHKSQAKDEL